MTKKKMKTYEIGTLAIAASILSILVISGLVAQGSNQNYKIIESHAHISTKNLGFNLQEINEMTGISKTILVSSPEETLKLNGNKSFTRFKENNNEVLELAKLYPNDFIPFCTVDPTKSNSLSYIKDCIKRGGKGIKIYNGHTYYHEVFKMSLNDPALREIYAYAEESQLPMMAHINIKKYKQELLPVLNDYPDLKLSIPHYMLSSANIEEVARLMDIAPNLYTDISFGSSEFMGPGFRRMSKDTKKYAEFIKEHADRILFATDAMFTKADQKDSIEESLFCYQDLLERRTFSCGIVQEHYQNMLAEAESKFEACEQKNTKKCADLAKKVETYKGRVNEVEKLNGLSLDHKVLTKIYEKNASTFLGMDL